MVIKRGIIMSSSSLKTEKDTNLFGSGTIWFITCVVVTAFPTLCSCIFRFVTENKILTLSLFLSKYLFVHLKDILLIAFSISCSLLALSIDKSKIIKRNMKKTGIIVSGASGVLSSFYYFYIDGKDDIYGENGINILYFYLCIIIICSIIGCLIGNKHDKYIKQSGSSK